MQTRWIILAFLLGVGALSAGVWRYGYRQALGQLEQRAEADLALASDRLTTQLQLFQQLVVMTAGRPELAAREAPGLAALLRRLADKSGALDLLYVDAGGHVVAAAQPGLIGPELRQAPYFRRALQGALGRGHGVVGALQRRAYFVAAPVFGADQQVRGALIVAVDLAEIERSWRGSLPPVFFTDAAGRVFISNRSDLLFWQRRPGQIGLTPPEGAAPRFSTRQEGSHELWRLDWGQYLPARALHLAQGLPRVGLLGEILIDITPARRLAGLQAAAVAAICLAFGALLFLATERRRTLAVANRELEARVADRTRALSDANLRLRSEVRERQEAEAALKQAQDDLVQAGKLSALGQMSAGISHELSQPLMAIRQFADNGAAFLARGRPDRAGENLDRIADLAQRMDRIIKNLRAFARNEREASDKVDLVKVLTQAVELTETRLKEAGVRLDWTAPAAPIHVWGGEVRLAQVFVNLINNAVDAMVGSPQKRISITLAEDGPRLIVRLQDSGPGIADPEKIFEPFYTTKEIAGEEGMGLGLSISYGLVQSFGGNIRGANAARGGAVFTVELDRWQEERAA
ncbi:sensor histidine kinase [Pseudodonghicola flavimaris]|uniref:histidine kinase n=1 Tax=Pseudodonghicola flavimaris TaxID=3050036 RepID=A0ABT7F6U3_9RHOB|nr:ATP-binding protein [Pseudodonghicola flavimaris]MDK3020323.1 ATP-binding protein [Pseudodonghicola flavimaris]